MFAVIFIPDFFLQAVSRHEPDLRNRLVALVDSELPKPMLVQCNEAARYHGVVEGLSASQAMARSGNLIIKNRSAAQEKTATEILLQTASLFSPNIEDTAPGVCTLELKGLGLNGENSLQQWAIELQRTFAETNLKARVGIAATPSLSHLAARGAETISFVGDESAFISALPIAALEPPPEILEILRGWGIRTVGEFIALGKNQVVERLGESALELFDRISSDSARPLKLVSPSPSFVEEVEFENEIETAQSLLFILQRFVEQLSLRLGKIYLVIAEFQLRLGLSSGAKHERVFKIPAPTGDHKILFRMLETHLETVRTDSPIVSLRLEAKPTHGESHQFGLFETTLRDPNQFAETLARLTALCGADRVGTPVAEATHRPDSFRVQVSQFVAAKTFAENFSTQGLALRRFRPPLKAMIEFRAEKPTSLRSSSCNGTIVEWRGPFRSSGHWWGDRRWAREEWDVQTADGALLRIFRSHEGNFVEGVYD